MSRLSSSSAALPIARFALRILIIVNWVSGAAIFALLALGPITRRWILSEFDLSPSPEADHLVMGLRAVAVIGLVGVPLYYVILTRLLAIVETVGVGDPFVAANATRLQTIARALLTLQLLGMVIDLIVRVVAIEGHPLDLDAGFSVSGWLAVLLTFVLARVFEEGAAMRRDLEGTV